MKMNKLYTLYIVMLLLFSFTAVADIEYPNEQSYPYPAGLNNDWLQGSGGFDRTALTTTKTRGLTGGEHAPLVVDLDDDGINEIIVLDGGGGSLKLYHESSLDIVDSINIPAGDYAPPITSDIDKDGLIEIILSNNIQGDFDIIIAEWDGISFTSYILSSGHWSGTFYNCDTLIQCNRGTDAEDDVECLQVLVCSPSGTTNKLILAFGFNNNTISSNYQAYNNPDADRRYCLPQVPALTYANIDNSGRGEFIFSYADMKTSETDYLKIINMGVSESLVVSISTLVSTSFDPFDTSETCQDGIGKYFTSPMVTDLDGSSGNGLEIVVGMMLSDNTYIMKVFNSQGTEIDTHPKFLIFQFTTEGQILGNPMKANVFGDTGLVDYCIAGQDLSNSEGELLKLLCGSQQTGWTKFFVPTNDMEFGFIKNDLFNITGGWRNPSMLGHMANMQDDNIDVTGGGLVTTDTSEFIGTHGVFQMTDEDFTGWWTGNIMERIYDIEFEASCIVVDAQKIGASDIICVRETAVQYIDDNLVNEPAYISDHREDPCIDSGTIRVNETMQIKLTIEDQNPSPLPPDLVSSRVTLYDGTSNAQVSELGNQTSGVQVIHLFTNGLNITGNVNLLYEAWDTGNPSVIDRISQTFLVASTGVRFGDCESGGVIIPDVITIGEECSNDEQCGSGVSCIGGVCVADEDTLPVRAMREASEVFGIGVTALWMMFMMALAIGFWFAPIGKNNDFFDSANARFGIIILGETFMLILGTMFGFIPLAIMITIIILGLIAGSIWMVKRFTGQAS